MGETEVLGEKHYTASVVDEWMSMEQWWNDTDRGKVKYSNKNLSQCQFSTLNLTQTELGSKPSFRGEKSAIHCLSHGTSHVQVVVHFYFHRGKWVEA
jgi:hypothetical protein